MNTASKIFLIVLLQIGFTWLFSFAGGLLALLEVSFANFSATSVSVTTSTFLTLLSTYFAMLALSKSFVIADIRTIPRWLSLIALGFGVLSTLAYYTIATLIANMIIAPVAQWIIPYLFLKRRFG